MRRNNCKARSSAARKGSDRTLSDGTDDENELAQLAGRYLDLWVEHWASCLAAPETAVALTRLFTPLGTAVGDGLERAARPSGAGVEPASLRTAPNAGDRRIDELEGRIAGLERKLAGLERKNRSGMVRLPGKPRGGSLKG